MNNYTTHENIKEILTEIEAFTQELKLKPK